MHETDEDRQDSLAVWPLIRRHGLIVLVVAAAAATAAYVVSDRQEPSFSTSALIQLPESTVDQQILQAQTGSPDVEARAQTNQLVVGSQRIAAATARRLGPGVPASEIESNVQVASEGNTQIVSIEATDSDPARAARLANLYAGTYRNQSVADGERRIASSRELLERQLAQINVQDQLEDEQDPRGASIADRLLQLELLSRSGSTAPQIVQRAEEPAVADSPLPRRNAALGGLFGLILGVGIAALRQQGDRRLRGQRDAERAFGSAVIATVPRSSRLRRPAKALTAREAEPFRLLQANLRYGGGGPRSLVVTSATEGEGKTTTAWNLALAAAASGSRVLFVEGDLRRPAVAARHGLEGSNGLVQVVGGGVALQDAVQPVAAGGGNGSGPTTIDVLVAGERDGEATDLFQSARMDRALEAMEAGYDFIVIDSPPINEVSDTIPLVKMADGVIVVGRLGRTTREQARRTRERLRALDVETLGVVANGARGSQVYEDD